MPENLHEWEAETLFHKLYRPLQIWLQQHSITYPWSHSESGSLPNSYAVWVSEVMLQQTRTETVRPYYSAWMQRWPSLAGLAAASEAQVLKQWEGLGYYSRALNMLKCAQKCAHDLGLNKLPLKAYELQSLPGIGPYIAAAIASISGNEPILAMDTNVKRVFSRLYQQQPSSTTERAWQQQHNRALVLCTWRGSANISLIQLGQQLCKATGPLCFRCPLEAICPANWAQFPLPKTYRRHKLQSQRLLLFAEGKCLLFRKCRGHLQHLWRFPELSQVGLPLSETEYLGSFRHAYLQTQEQIEVLSCRSNVPCREWDKLLARQGHEWLWAEDLSELTLAGPYRRFLQELGLS